MIEITEKAYQPSIEEISDYIANPLFLELYAAMQNTYQALCSVDYSGDRILLGWNVRFYRAGRTLCRLYPKQGFFSVLVVIGRKEKERTEALLPRLSDETRRVYENTREGMGQRWLLFDVTAPGGVYQDLLQLVKIRSTGR